MYTAMYSRVSTGMQAAEGTSLEGQVEICTKKARELGIPENILRIYKEEGFTGEDIDRPAMNELRQDVSSGKIKRLIVTHPDRLTRDLTDKLILCRELERFGVELVFVDTEYRNTPEGQLFFNLMSSIAQYELSLIKKRTVRGRLKAVEKEKKIMPMRVPPYGYDYQANSLVINEEEASFVRQIYHWYVYDHSTLREIGERLYSLGVSPKRGESRNWSASSIRRILTSEIYVGKYFYNRRQTRKLRGEKTKSGAPKKSYEYRDEKEWLEVSVPAIVEDQLFEMAQIQRKRNTKKSGNVKYEYLLKSLIRCGHCGRMWQATTYNGRINKQTGEMIRYTCYRCPNLFPKKYGDGVKKCPSQTVRAETLDIFIWQLVMEIFSNPKDYLQRLQSQKSEIRYELQTAIHLITKQIEQKDKERDKVKTMFKREVIDEKEMVEELQKINSYKQTLQQELETYQTKLSEIQAASAYNEHLIKEIKQFLDNANETFSLGDKREIIETLINEIEIKFELDQIQITADGALDQLLLQHSDEMFVVSL